MKRYVGLFQVVAHIPGCVEIGINAMSLHEATQMAHEMSRKCNLTYIGVVERE